MKITSHEEICELLEIPRYQPTKYPWVERATKVVVHIEGERRFVFGGALKCSNKKCGFGVDMIYALKDKSKCPKCGNK